MRKPASRVFSLLLALIMILSMLPASVFAASDTAKVEWNITLSDSIGVNFYLTLSNPAVTTVQLDGKTVTLGQPNDNGKYVVTCEKATGEMTDEISLVITANGAEIYNGTYSVREYADVILGSSKFDNEVKNLVRHMLNVGGKSQTYFKYNTENLANKDISVVEAEPVGNNEFKVTDNLSGVDLYGTTLLFESKTAVRYYFTVTEGSGKDYTYKVGDVAYTPVSKGGLWYVEIDGINPQDLADDITLVVSKNGSALTATYSPLTYIVRMYNKDSGSTDQKVVARRALVKAMYNYYLAAVEYQDYVMPIVDKLTDPESWSAGGTKNGETLTVPANSSLKADYLKALWEEGYTHLVFTVNAQAASDNNTNFTHGGTWNRYWQTFTANTNLDLRIDLNEFHDGDAWYSINFNAGEMTVSKPRGYKSAETLSWTKSNSNVYFAVEDGYYVLETRGNDFGVTSPASWLKKYMVSDDAGQRTWLMYTDYIKQDSNTRSMLWGWGSPVNTVHGDVNGGWAWNNNVSADREVFSLQLDKAGTARFKLLDWVSNRNSWNNDLAISYVDAQTIRWSAASNYKLRLATTQDLIAAGYKTLRVTLTGDLGSAQIWYGEDDWSDGEICVSADSFVDGACTFEVDLTAFNAGENFTMMANLAAFTDLLVKIEPIKPVYYSVTAPAGDGFTFSGAETVLEGSNYSFTVTPNDGYKATVKVNGQTVTGDNGTYTVENVTSDLVITVDTKVLTTLEKLATAGSWSAGGTESADSLTVPANSSLKADYLKALWAEGYTHLVFTVNAQAASDNNTNFTHGGTWNRYWQSLTANTDLDLRIDLNEFHDGDTWYPINFNAGEMTVSNPRGYKSAETLSWTKSSTNCYFAIEDGYYVLETRGNDFGVISPAAWLKKYMVNDDVSQRSWLMYTDYISKRDNTRSMLWGWGSAVNTVHGDVNGGWAWNNNVTNDHEVFSLHMDKAGTARFKLLDWVSNRNSWNNDLAISYVDAQTIRWSAANEYKLRLATTQDLIAAGYNTLRVTLTGDLGSAQIWYGEDDWSDGEICVSADSFVDGACTFDVDLRTFQADETFTLMASAASFTDLLVKIEPLTLELPAITYSVTAPSGNDFIFDGAATVEHNSDYAFTVIPVADSTTLTVYVNGTRIEPVSDNNYVVENVTADLTITVDADVFAPEDVILCPESWTANSSNNGDTLTTAANSQLTGAALKQLWDEGYTHLVFTVNAQAASDNNTNYTNGGQWDRYWANFDAAADVDIRIDLNEFHDGDTWYNVNFNAGAMTVSKPRGYKSAETLSWTKSSTNVYFALEDGYYVLETRGNDFGVISPAAWLAKYMVSDDPAGQRTWLMYTDYISKRDNTRSMLWGWGSAVNTVCGDVNGGWAWNNNVTNNHEVFSLHMDKAGTARFKLLDWVSNRNSWNNDLAISYVDAQTIRWSAASDYKLRLATTQDLIAAGYNTLRVTLTGDLGSAMVWYGEDDWSDGESGVSANVFVDGSYTFEVDLTAFNAGENFTMMVSGAAFNDLLVKIEPADKLVQYPVKLISVVDCELVGDSYATAGQDYTFRLSNTDANVTLGTVTVNGTEYEAVDGVYTVPAASVTCGLVIRVEDAVITNAIVAADGSYIAAADLMEGELDAVSGDRGVYTKRENITYTNSILLGTATTDAKVTNETYTVSGDGTNIYIDGNCKRAVAYGVADYLRSLGYEFYTAEITTRPASVSLNFSMAELTDTADFAVRSYLSKQTSYNENSLTDQAFTVLSKNNNSLVATYDSFGGVETEDFNGGVHNFTNFFTDQTEGKYGYEVSTGLSSPDTGFAPCLTNGITYNVGGADTTLTYAVARMKEAILANPDAYYFSFCQNDGPTWYCDCDHCNTDAATYNRSGTLVNFINAMIAQLEADPDLSGRDFKILTFAYDFTAKAPVNVSALSDKLQVWYAQWHNANYSINSDSQDLYDYTENLRTWADLTADGNLSLWLYDAHFSNYLAYFPSVNTIAANIAEAKALGVSDILVLGAYNAESIWHDEMKAYIWSKLLWDSSLNVETLQQDFLKAYFGEAAYNAGVKTFVDLYDDNVGGSANREAGYPICSGYGYFCHVDVYSLRQVHAPALDAANAAIKAIAEDTSLSEEEKAIYTQRANELLATVYGSVIGNWNKYRNWSIVKDPFSSFKTYFGANTADCQEKLTNALSAAGITKACESEMTLTEWVNWITNRYG